MKNVLKKLIILILSIVIIGIIGGVVFAPAYVEQSRNKVATHAPYLISDRARALHDALVIGDWHAGSLLWNRNLADRGNYGQLDIPRLIEGNVAVQVFSAVTKSFPGQAHGDNDTETFDNITPLVLAQLWPPRTWGNFTERALYQAEKLALVQRQIPDRLKIIRTLEDLNFVLAQRAAGNKIVGAVLGVEGADALEGDISNLLRLESAGFRLIGFHQFNDNAFGGSLYGDGAQGLTDLGRALVSEIGRRGFVLDVALSSEQVVSDILDMVDFPVVLSHTGIRSVCDVKRNISLDLMRKIADAGGVVGIGYWQGVSCDNSPAGIARTILAETDALGIDAVSLGSGFDGSVTTRFDVSELAAITQELLNLGMKNTDIRKVMGENMIRVLRARLSRRP